MKVSGAVENRWRINFGLLLFVAAFTSCESEKRDNRVDYPVHEAIEPIAYQEFTPNSSNMRSTIEMIVESAFELDSFTLVSGSDPIIDCGQSIMDDTINGWGKRLYLFNAKNELIFKSKGVGDSQLNEPHFYRNKANGSVFIICQLAFDYQSGGDVFLFENGTIKYIGEIEIAGPEMDITLEDILDIRENRDEITFTFSSDSVVLYPGSKPERMVASRGVNYTYKNDTFKFVKSAQ